MEPGETTPGGICNFSLGKSLWNVWLIVPGWTQLRFVNENNGVSGSHFSP